MPQIESCPQSMLHISPQMKRGLTMPQIESRPQSMLRISSLSLWERVGVRGNIRFSRRIKVI
jgi:hypothetical protein